eukprot:CFRG2792T1
MIFVRKTAHEDVSLLPDIERSAGERFLTIPELSWVAQDTVISVDEHRDFVKAGYSWVILDDDSIVGFVVVMELAGRKDLHVCELSVNAEKQGMGLGRLLMDTIISHGRENLFKGISLTTFRSIKWNRLFYERLGFTTLSEVEVSHHRELTHIVEREARVGLSREVRCAMYLGLS